MKNHLLSNVNVQDSCALQYNPRREVAQPQGSTCRGVVRWYSMLVIVVAVCQSTVGHSVLACMTSNFESAFDSGENIGLPWLMTDNGKLAFDSRAFDCAEGASKTFPFIIVAVFCSLAFDSGENIDIPYADCKYRRILTEGDGVGYQAKPISKRHNILSHSCCI